MIILKEEINASTAHVLDLAKWKLVAIAGVAVFGLGWSGEAKPDPASAVLLLLSAGLLCAYVDLLIYRRFVSLHAIARYLRHYGGSDAEMLELKQYELDINSRRHARKFWISEEAAHLLSSLAFSISLPLAAYLRYPAEFRSATLLIAFVGVALVAVLFVTYGIARRRFLAS